MATDYRTLIEDFVEVIQDRILGYVEVAEQTDMPRPSMSGYQDGFTACKITNVVQQGLPEYSQVDTNGVQQIKLRNQITIQLQAFGPNALGRLDCLVVEFYKKSFKGVLCQTGLSFIDASDVIDISTTLDTNWEERAQLEMRFNHTLVIEDEDVGCIENVDLTSIYINCAGDTVREVFTEIRTP